MSEVSVCLLCAAGVSTTKGGRGHPITLRTPGGDVEGFVRCPMTAEKRLASTPIVRASVDLAIKRATQ